jgi:uncharacterized protein with HXXEE motif
MDSRGRIAFALVVLVQAAHSLEECVFRLFDVFAPARWVAGLLTSDRALGFALANACIVLFGVWCYWARVRPADPSARWFAWLWAGVELANGIGHISFALRRGEYFPGVATAPLLIAASCYLGSALLSRRGSGP